MLREQIIQIGSDPEFFFEKNGKIIGAERVIPEKGLDAVDRSGHFIMKQKALILDGVQVEINPTPHSRTSLTVCEMSAIFKSLKDHLRETPEIKACFKTLVEVDREELDSLSEQARIFGCAPSQNAYNAVAKVGVDAKVYPFRAAGGHIHLGLHRPTFGINSYDADHRLRLVPLLDIFVGNTMVLIDRDPGVAERRKHYGRAGEFRLPKYGLEYRTVGNFWLRHHFLFGFVSGMCKLANTVLYETITGGPNLEQELVETVDIMQVIKAINENDWDLAYKNHEVVKKFIRKYGGIGFGLTPGTLDKFDYFAKTVREKGIESWFPMDPVDHWSSLPFISNELGWEQFLDRINLDRLPGEKA
jgi:hypothetical protein